MRKSGRKGGDVWVEDELGGARNYRCHPAAYRIAADIEPVSPPVFRGAEQTVLGDLLVW
ncbi:MAG: hypothetical protein AB7G93_21445 [Bdellovibrionales bacterium]